MSVTNAGLTWVGLYPTSCDVDDLVEPFRSGVVAFVAELTAQGCGVHISATRRPAERAWLMHWAWRVSRGEVAPDQVPPRDPSIPIVWSVEGAQEMVTAYRLAYRPSLTSRHIEGRAIDMSVTRWRRTTTALHDLGATFGVVKLVSDPPHWSDDGR